MKSLIERSAYWFLAVSAIGCLSASASTLSYSASGMFSGSNPTSAFSAPNQKWAFTFQADRSPTVLQYGNGGFSIAFSNFTYSLNGSHVTIAPSFIRFFTTANGGGLMICFNGTSVATCTDAIGALIGGAPQMFTGTTSAPTLSVGAFPTDMGIAVNSVPYDVGNSTVNAVAGATPTCNPPQVVQGGNCTLTVNLPWATAGLGMQSMLTVYVPPNASGPVTFHVVGLSSSLGSSYTGYFGFRGGGTGSSNSHILTLADITTGAPGDIGQIAPGQGFSSTVTQVCWDPTCTSPAPSGAIPNMFSMQVLISTPVTTDINPNDIQGTVQFLNGSGEVTFETTESSIFGFSHYTIVPGVNIGATPAVRYVMNGAAFTAPFDAFSVTNLNNSNPITGIVTLQDFNGNNIVSAPIPAIPPGGAVGYLVIGRTPDDSLGLFPSDTVLPAGSDGIFHGVLLIQMNGLVPSSQGGILAQEYNGNAMVNLPIFHSAVP